MFQVRRTELFSKWLDSLADTKGRARILVRIEHLAMGYPGDAKSVGEGISELRIDVGPGYRVYYTQVKGHLIVLLAGGDKGSQTRDIRTAIRLARNLEEP